MTSNAGSFSFSNRKANKATYTLEDFGQYQEVTWNPDNPKAQSWHGVVLGAYEVEGEVIVVIVTQGEKSGRWKAETVGATKTNATLLFDSCEFGPLPEMDDEAEAEYEG